MHKKSIASACLFAMSVSFVSLAATAQEATLHNAAFNEDVGAQERINLSSKLRMLSQRIASASCHLVEGDDIEAASTLLANDSTEFDKILNALVNGDAELNVIGAEERRKTLVKIASVKELWEPMKVAVYALTDQRDIEANLETVILSNSELLNRAAVLVTEIVC